MTWVFDGCNGSCGSTATKHKMFSDHTREVFLAPSVAVYVYPRFLFEETSI